MADNYLVTGSRGGNVAHVSSSQARNFNAGVVGGGRYVMYGLGCTVSSANKVHVDPGVACFCGADVEVPPGGADLTIENGSQGMKRNDLVVLRYEGGSPEGVTLAVIKGTPSASSPVDPSYNDGDIRSGDSPCDMPLWRVPLDGISVGDPVPVYETVPSAASLRDSVSRNLWKTLLANAAHYARSGGLVVVQIYNLTLQKSVRRSVGTLPEGFRPTGAATWDGRSAVGLVFGGGSNLAYAYVSPSGEVWCDYAPADGDYTGQVVFPA